MRIQDLLSSREATQIGLFIAQRLPRQVGYAVASGVANWIAHRKPAVYWTVRANLQQVLGPVVDTDMLHRMVRSVFVHAGKTYCDFFRAMCRPSAQLAEAVRIPDPSLGRIQSAVADRRGLLLLGIHTSNFNLPIVSLGARGLPVLVLSLADAGTGNYLVDHLRSMGGIQSIPITPESLRMAVRWLKRGNVVITGADLPTHGDGELIEFFGRPAYLPVGPARLALMTEATVLLGSCRHDPNEGYVLDVTGPIEMPRTGHRADDSLAGTRQLALVMERYIRARPEQWLMFHRVWPERSPNL